MTGLYAAAVDGRATGVVENADGSWSTFYPEPDPNAEPDDQDDDGTDPWAGWTDIGHTTDPACPPTRDSAAEPHQEDPR